MQESLQGLLSKERERFTETLKEAVNAAQLTTEKEMERKMEVGEGKRLAYLIKELLKYLLYC